MIDTNLINTASNLLVQAGYTIKAAPTPPAPIDYTQLASLITTAVLALLAAVAGIGRAIQAWKTGQTARAAIFLGANRPKLPLAAVKLVALAVCMAGLCGCQTASSLLTPAALTTEVATGVRVGLDVYPAAAPGVMVARDSICAAAMSTNTSPAAIVADLENLGVTDSNTKLIVDAALLLYEGVYDLIGTNNTGKVQPYTQALCDGLTQGLPGAGVARKAMMQPILPPHWK
ncbi:MAG TPA: hypothetical protein VMQ76_13105 [Terracidiphilus sp.]|nr:hypothetical protein [Terracidiphilus sp.]